MNRPKSERARLITALRDHRRTEPVRLVTELIRLRTGALLEEMITAEPHRIRMLQGAITELRDLEAALSSQARERERKDGAYA